MRGSIPALGAGEEAGEGYACQAGDGQSHDHLAGCRGTSLATEETPTMEKSTGAGAGGRGCFGLGGQATVVGGGGPVLTGSPHQF